MNVLIFVLCVVVGLPTALLVFVIVMRWFIACAEYFGDSVKDDKPLLRIFTREYWQSLKEEKSKKGEESN